MIRLVTDRLIIRDHVDDDIHDMHSLLSDEQAMFYLPEIRTKNMEESENNLKVALYEAGLEKRTKFFHAIIDRNKQIYIGEIGFTKIIDSKLGNVMSLGYFIKKEYWGKGIVTEACRAVISYAFLNLNTIKIGTGCLVDNVGSEKVMKKLGMIKEAEFKKHVLLNDELFDRVEYRLMKEEWQELMKNTEWVNSKVTIY